MLGAAFAATRPRGLQRLILASGLASKDLSIRSIELRRKELPSETLRVLEEYEQRGELDNPAYKEASMVFSKTFVCRDNPLPELLMPAYKNLTEDKTVYGTMYVASFPLILSLPQTLHATQSIRPSSTTRGLYRALGPI